MFINLFKYINFIVRFYNSDGIHCSGQTKVGRFNFSAVVPVIEIVTTVVTTLLLPSESRGFSLMLHHNALLELSVEVFAAIALIHSDEHRVKFVLSVLPGDIGVSRLAHIVVPERHFSSFVFNY